MRAIRYFLMLAVMLMAMTATGWRASAADSLKFVVRGSVRDAATGRALEAVGVSIKGTTIATITNRDGAFIIKSDTPPESLVFSLIGYSTQTVPVPENNAEMKVRMTRGTLLLDPATVIDGDPVELVRYAISQIANNAPEKAELFDCFYRETVQKRQRYIYVSEAVTKVYKAAVSNVWGRDRGAVVKSRLLRSPRTADTLGVKVVGGPVMAVNLDLVKSRSMLIDESELPLYKFVMKQPDVIDGRPQLVIGFTPAVVENYALHQGTIYIDRQTFGFTRIEASLDVSDPVKATRAMLVNRPAGLRFKPREMSLLLNYKEDGGKYRLSYLRTCFRFFCDWRKKLFATDYTVVAEMVVTNRHSGQDAVPIQRAEEFNPSFSLADKTSFYSDPDFWQDYNIIEPSVSLEQAISRLKK